MVLQNLEERRQGGLFFFLCQVEVRKTGGKCSHLGQPEKHHGGPPRCGPRIRGRAANIAHSNSLFMVRSDTRQTTLSVPHGSIQIFRFMPVVGSVSWSLDSVRRMAGLVILSDACGEDEPRAGPGHPALDRKEVVVIVPAGTPVSPNQQCPHRGLRYSGGPGRGGTG